MAHRRQRILLTNEELVERVHEAIHRSRKDLKVLRLKMQELEDRQIEVRARQDAWLVQLAERETRVAKISRLFPGNLPREGGGLYSPDYRRASAAMFERKR